MGRRCLSGVCVTTLSVHQSKEVWEAWGVEHSAERTCPVEVLMSVI